MAAFCAVAYAGLLALLARAWCGQAAGGRQVALSDAVRVYGKAVLAKYLPGSVFQYASRQWLGLRAGMAQGAMAKASLVEIVLHIAFSAGIGAALLIGETPLAYLVLLGAGGAIAAVALRGGPGALGAVIWQAVFFFGFAGLVWLMATQLGAPMGAGKLTGWFMVAWLAGFLVPLAPGGVGVREAALLALGGAVNAAPILAVALVLRLITLAGDAIFGAAAYAGRSGRNGGAG